MSSDQRAIDDAVDDLITVGGDRDLGAMNATLRGLADEPAIEPERGDAQ